MNRRTLFSLFGLGAVASVAPSVAAPRRLPPIRGAVNSDALRALTEKLNASGSLKDAIAKRNPQYVLYLSRANGETEKDYFPTFEAAQNHVQMRKRQMTGRIQFSVYGPRDALIWSGWSNWSQA